MEACVGLGISADQLSYGHTIKKSDIEKAHAAGIDLFAFDSAAEMEKLGRAAPGSRVFCRLVTKGEGADWPLSKKFGCQVQIAEDLLARAKDCGLQPHGISFHVGSQQKDPEQWDAAIAEAAALFHTLDRKGVSLELINLGGGLPARYLNNVPTTARYGGRHHDGDAQAFRQSNAEDDTEPGQGLVGDAGVIQAEVVLIAERHNGKAARWVYLDIREVWRLAGDDRRGHQIPYHHAARRRRDGPSILAGAPVKNSTCSTSTRPIRCRRTCRWRPDRVSKCGRLHLVLRGGLLQRHSTAQATRDMKATASRA